MKNASKLVTLGLLTCATLPLQCALAIPLDGDIFTELPNDPMCQYQLHFKRTDNYGTEQQVIASTSVYIDEGNDGYHSKSISFDHGPVNLLDLVQETFPKSLSEEEINLWVHDAIVKNGSLNIIASANRPEAQITGTLSAISSEKSFARTFGFRPSTFHNFDLTFKCPDEATSNGGELEEKVEQNTSAIESLRSAVRALGRRFGRGGRRVAIR